MRARRPSSARCSRRSNSSVACSGRCSTCCTLRMCRRGISRPAPSCRRSRDDRRRPQAEPAARRAAYPQRGAGRMGAARAGARIQGRRTGARDHQALHRRRDRERDRGRSGENLQRAARAHHGRRVGDAGGAGREKAAGSLMDATPTKAPRPLGLLAELTHRCPLGCPYCSNPLALEGRADELDTATWARVFQEAAALGVLQVHLSGGEPGARRDLVAITQAAHEAGLYTNLITSAVGITKETFAKLSDAGLDHVQISIQDSEAAPADRIAGYKGAYARKQALAAEVTRLGIPLTVNAVMHRANIDHVEQMVALALTLGAKRVEIAHVQYYGWALKNRAQLMPTREQVDRAVAAVEKLRKQHHGQIVIDAVVPDYYARFPKACVGGWGRTSLNVTPSGKVLPRHAAESIHGLTSWNARV